MTPHDIDFLLWCYSRPAPYPTLNSLAAQDTVNRFISAGLIELADKENKVYYTTGKGEAHVKNLCSLELPEQAWVDANGNIIK